MFVSFEQPWSSPLQAVGVDRPSPGGLSLVFRKEEGRMEVVSPGRHWRHLRTGTQLSLGRQVCGVAAGSLPLPQQHW